MARPLRIEIAGGWYHITARRNECRSIYRDPRDRQHFLELLAEMVSRFGLRAHAFMLMDNHYHLLLELKEANLSRAIQWLNVSYSVWFNRRYARSGHLLEPQTPEPPGTTPLRQTGWKRCLLWSAKLIS